MSEFLKGYAAGANDMEAGRLVTKENLFPPCCYDDLGNEGRGCQLLVERAVEIESLREQLKEAEGLSQYAADVNETNVAVSARNVKLLERAKAAEAKLAEANERLDEFWHEAQDRKAKLAEVETSLKATETRLALVEEDRDLRVQILTNALGTEKAELADRLAEVEKMLKVAEEHADYWEQKVAEVEKERDVSRAVNADLIRSFDARVAEVEKEAHAGQLLAADRADEIVDLRARMNGARELTLHPNRMTPSERFAAIHRLLSGDE